MNKKYLEADQLTWHSSLSNWKTKAGDFVTDYTSDHEIGAFGFRGVLPSDHTQNSNCFHQVTRGGKYVQNLLPNMPGTIKTVDRFYSLSQYDKLVYDLQQECEEVYEDDHKEESQSSSSTRASKRTKSNNQANTQEGAEETPKVIRYVQHLKIEVPMDPNSYEPYYASDPFSNPRVTVRDKDYERLCKVEKKFNDGIYIGCIALGMTLCNLVQTHMEAPHEYKVAKLTGRIDVLVRLILVAVITGGASQQKCTACPNSRTYFTNISIYREYVGTETFNYV